MKYISTRNSQLNESFENILFQGLSRDSGLFVPKDWPLLEIKNLRNKTYEQVALSVIMPFVGDGIPEEDMYEIISSSYKKFTHSKIAPLVKIDDNKYVLELFYGPTFAFKDYALQFLGNLFSYYLKNNRKKITILGATSGDTGSAAINAFKSKKNINIFILHPHDKISEVQRRQMTSVSDDNVHNIAVKGTFDDCQKIVKKLFIDNEIQQKTSLTAINSINWARIMAQIVYYFWAFIQLDSSKLSFVVPSGNFGNIYSARVAKHMGLPISKLHIATNQNDILHKIVSLGQMQIQNVLRTYSPSMDIQISSNFERQLFESVNYDSNKVIKIMHKLKESKNYIFEDYVKKDLKNIYESSSSSDEKILETIKIFKEKYDYLADPHTATGLSVINEKYFNHPVISLACAHPAKFPDAIKKSIGNAPEFPKELEKIFDKKEKMNILSNDSQTIKDFIINNI
tara:strand:- start:7803 stop:9170 length:1368 start_codon:yes stop_codon:yes gene_type:complete